VERFGASMLPSHRAALRAIAACRTPELGGHVGECDQCGHEHLFFHSCRHRACPQCGYDAASRWLARQRELLLPVPYFHVVFTVPDELRRLMRQHQRALLAALFRAAFESLAALCANPKHLGAAQIGVLAVLHTWTRTLEWHPHIHMLVPGGGLADDGRTWMQTPKRRTLYLVPVKALSKIFRACLLRRVADALPEVALSPALWTKPWVVFAKPVVHGPERVLEYLGRYVYRTALSDKALVAADGDSVTFSYRRSTDPQRKTLRLPVQEFLRRFLQHVPPKGFHRVRTFGLLHASQRDKLRRLQLLLSSPRSHTQTPTPTPPAPKPRCPNCQQGTLRLVRRLSSTECLDFLAAAAVARAPPSPSAKGASP
jgi:Putative transposase/Transposase zinc-binding domain